MIRPMQTTAVLAALLMPVQAYAYLDAGTASIIFQGAAAALFGLTFAIKVYWHKIRRFFSRDDSETEDEARPVEASSGSK